ncbi:MAG: T9SS type A sorting domain-containing protein, partial [candidate division KSB1 bacterium]|nr:T9SS type A sorting domain-containing protein [candidate division KSB1 bacterium]
IGESNFHLQEGSPCRDAGNPHPDHNDRDGARNDVGATGGPYFDRDLLVDVAGNEFEAYRPGEFTLYANYPNPFNPSTVISFHVPEESDVSIAIYNVLGEEVALIHNSVQEAGVHEITWDASDLPGGVYFVRVALDGVSKTGKMMVVR